MLIAMDDGLDLNNIINHVIEDLNNPIPNEVQNYRRYRKPRNENYFEITIPSYSNIQFLEHFRMSRYTFEVCIFM